MACLFSKAKKSTPWSKSLVLIVGMLTLPVNARWSQNGVTVAGGNGDGNATNQLHFPWEIDIDDDNQTIVIADFWNHRIVEWKIGEKNGKVIAGGRDQGCDLDQLHGPSDVLIDKKTDSLFIADWGNRRILRLPRQQGNTQAEVIVDNINCCRLAMDHERCLYVSDIDKHEVRRYAIGDKNGTVVAAGNGRGNLLNQLNLATNLFVDEKQAVYVADHNNHRVMKWNKGAKEGIIVAGGRGEGSALTQLHHPRGVFVDTSDAVYVADSWNHRVMRWYKGSQEGTVIVGGNGEGERPNQFRWDKGLVFDCQGNLYVVDCNNNRVQRFDIE